MRSTLFPRGLAAVLVTAVLFLSGCHYQLPPHPKMERAGADERMTKADRPGYTVAMVEQALQRYDANGREATVAYYNTPESVDGEWYVFIADENNQLIAHANPDVLGESLLGDLVGLDITGYRHGEVIASATEEGIWVDYIFLNLATGNHEYKHSWVVRHDGLIFGSGWYQVMPGVSSDAVATKADRPGYTVALVEQALQRYDADGREAAVAYYNTPESVDGEWYVFIADENNQIIASPNPDLLGESLLGDLGVDITGYRHGEVIASATEEGMWVDYIFLNPATGNQEYKHSWVVRHDGLIFASGWYQVMPGVSSDAAATKADRPGYTVAMVEQALRRYDANGREATVAYYNTPESVDGEWYVFIADENNQLIAHANPDVLGESLLGDLVGLDITGYRHGEVIAGATEEGIWVDYIFLNLATGNYEYKHSWVVRHDGLIFGSGWYQVMPGVSSDAAATKADRPGYTVAMVEQALQRYDADGREATVAYYNTPESVDGEWYVFIADENNQLIAHANPDVLGESLLGDLVGLDITGYRHGEVIASATEEGIWVDYIFLNLATGNYEYKHSWVVRHDGLIFGSGWYQVMPGVSSDAAATKADRPGYTVALVDQALQRYDADGREATVAYYNTPESVDGEWYVFIADENDQIIAHPNPDVLGESLLGDLGVDITGYRHGEVIAGATEEGMWVDYIFLNPATGNQEYKHSWVVRHDGLIFVSGWYQVMPGVSSDAAATKADRPGYTVAMVEQALQRYDADGREAAVAYYNTPESVDGEWYVFIADENNQLIAHANPDVLGESLLGDLVGLDITGYRHGEVIAGATEEGIWVDYIFLNLATGNQEYKHSWVVRHDGLIFGSGWYQVLPASTLGATKSDPAEYTVAFVDQALRYYKAHGRDEAVAYFSSPESVDGEWYIFIIDENDLVIAHPVPDIIGQDMKGDLGVDSSGHRHGDLMRTATEEGLWVDYLSASNPTTDGAEEQTKHAWVVRHDGLLFGSGWYE